MKGRRFLSSVLTALVISVTLGAASVQAASVERTGGSDRIETANQLAVKSFSSAKNVILVNGYGYADAVSATPLAKQLDAPILLTENKGTLEPSVVTTIKNLGAANVYIVGGTGVVSPAIEKSLKENYAVERIAGVTDTSRMGTNAEVAKKVLSLSGQKSAILVNGQDGYADALSVASIAAKKGYPVLFASRTEVAPVIKEVAKDLTILGVGGSWALPDTVLKTINGTKITDTAEKSKDRFATNLAVLDYFKNDLDFTNIYVAAGGATSTQFADALVASAAAAKAGSPLVLSGIGANGDQIAKANEYILAKATESGKIIIVGGTGSVSRDIEAGLITQDSLEIISIE